MRRIGDDKKGQQMTLTTLIIIALGILVLVLLIFGFTTGWKNLWGKINIWSGGESNVAAIAGSCNVACDSASVDDYCTRKRVVKFGEERELVTDEPGPIVYERGETLTASCKDLATKYKGMKLGVKECPGLCP